MMLRLSCLVVFALSATGTATRAADAVVATVDVASYPSLQAAIDANPGRILRLPPGEYQIAEPLVIGADRVELHGPARIVQTNPHASILQVRKAREVRLNDLTLTRSAGRQDTDRPGLEVLECTDVEITRVRVADNHSRASILAADSRDVVVQECTVTNYKGLTIDDRSRSPLYGYAFRAIDGTGIQLRNVVGGIVRNNRVQEFRLLPTKETCDRHELGRLTQLNDPPGRLVRPELIRSRQTNNWHQGAGIHVTGPRVSRHVLVTGNFIENAAQGIDLHADHVTASNNLIAHCMIGVKTMHGSKHVMIVGNQISYVDLWGIVVQPGTASQASANAEGAVPAVEENVDGGSVVANNVISNFGFGKQYWNWEKRARTAALNFSAPPLAENPPLRNLVVSGNVVHDSGRDTVLVDGKWTTVPPRYHYAVILDAKPNSAVNVRFSGNVFDPGSRGVSDVPLVAAEP